ncbi:MAG: efflux RND transporter permease subunit [Phycisphaerae bacterium]|nr:efflux RND transporter permease subunit [Phycisphaerae bacterium]
MTSLPKFSVDNPVLVGVVMLTILVGGVYSSLTLVREMFPETTPNTVAISTVYPGATPDEVERGISLRIEEAVKDIKDVDKIETRISEGLSTIIITMTSEAKDIDLVVNDVKAAVDAIPRDELPEEAEETRVTKFEPRLPVISVALFGDVGEKTLKTAGRRLRDDLLLLPGISDVELSGTRKAELTVEVQPEKLVEYRLSLAQVAEAIRQSNLDLPAGQLKTPGQNVAVRTMGETDQIGPIADTIVKTSPTGQIVRVADLGRVIDGFEDSDVKGRFNGKPSVDVTIYKTADQDAIAIATKVKAFVAGKRREPMEWDWIERLKHRLGIASSVRAIYHRACNDPYPPDVEVLLHSDLSRFIEGRLDLLKRNGSWGLLFVFGSLLLFLNWRVAFWVMMGLVLSIAGGIMMMNLLGATLNLISMFGLIVVLGLIVDDAIVVGENVYARVERGEDPKLAAVKGTEEVTWPVLIAVLTTIAAFLPLMFIEGRIGDFMGVLPVVVMCALAVSLVEAFSILPSHLAEWLKPVGRDIGESAPRHWLARRIMPIRRTQRRWVQDVLGKHYERLLRLAVRYRYVTVAAALGALIVSVGFIAGGRVPIVFIQKMDSETLLANVEMPVGTPVEQTQQVLEKIENAALALPEVKTIYGLVGAQVNMREISVSARSHLGQAIIELVLIEERDKSSDQIIAELRESTSDIPGVNSLTYNSIHGGPGGNAIEIEVTGKRLDDLLTAAEALKSRLATFDGVSDITDDFEQGRREVQITLLDSARPLGLTTRLLATEIRGAFYGLDARTLQRDREDVNIRVRFPEHRRRHVYELENMRIVTPSGHMVPFSEVARLQEGRGYCAIRRVDQRRAVVVTADVDQARGNAEKITAALVGPIAELERRLAGVRIAFAGSKRELDKSLDSLNRDFLIAVLVIFVMLAGLFKNYTQPLVVLTAVPFGIIGAVAGHFIMGYPLTILSMIGLVALTGIAVNDALILVDFINKEIAAGRPIFEAVINGGRRRMRPILLTSMTTILGLAPLMVEQSLQARFLIPMAISITFGLAFATVLTLVVVPCFYMIRHDAYRVVARIWRGPAHQS